LSGIEAVRKIVETEAQAKRIVEEANSRAQEILARASEEVQKIRQTSTIQAEQRKAQILRETREKAEAEARRSDVETDSLLENYRKLFENRKDAAAKKAVELILGS
jgi:V/A-type H+/Na+-transporting ATPase subunit G/H